MPFYPNRRKPKAKRSYKPKPKRKVSNQRIARIAKQVVSQSREYKLKQFTVSNYALSPYNRGDSTLGINTVSMVCLTPNDIPGTYPTADLAIAQGADTDERIGSQITMKNGQVRLFLNANIYDVTYNIAPQPMIVQVFIGYDRTTGNGQPSATLPEFYEFNGQANAPTGEVLDTFKRINTERYVVVTRRTYKIGNAEYFGSGSGQPSTVGRQYYTNNDFQLSKQVTIDYSKHMIKKVKYVKDGDQTPSTRQLWMWWLMTPMTGAVTGGERQVNINMECTVKYTDA